MSLATTRLPDARATSPAAPKRDPLLDNAKFFALVLVVVGHAWEGLRGIGVVDDVYIFLYTFHIGVFVALAGYHSRSPLNIGRVIRLAVSLLVPYAIFEFLYESMLGWVDGYEVHHNLWAPNWIMWFLVALFCWRLSAPIWRRLPAPVAISAAIAISLLGGLSTNDDLAVVKTMGLLPFFVVGVQLNRGHLEALRRPAWRFAAGGMAGTVLAVCTIWTSRFDVDWLRWRYSYDEMGSSTGHGMAVRLALIVLGLAMAAAFICVLPDRRSWFTDWGMNTMYAYLLHGFVIQLAVAAAGFESAWVNTTPGALAVGALAACLALALMNPRVARIAWPWSNQPGSRRSVRRRTGASSHQLGNQACSPRVVPGSLAGCTTQQRG